MAHSVTEDQAAAYHRDGFVRIPEIIDKEDAARYAKAALAARDRVSDLPADPAFTHVMQLWKHDETLRELTLSPVVAAAATALAGVPLRLYHDHLLIKEPHNGAATEFHQDQPYWPHLGSRHSLSAWIALVDVPVSRGCMSFIPGTHRLDDLHPQDLRDADNLMRVFPHLRWEPRVTVPLRAGDCTFHHSLTAHTASPNLTDDPRIAHVVVYMDADTRYDPRPRPAAGPLPEPDGTTAGTVFPDDDFPRLP
ncbi:phytanoyl-CoA dioxygenase family protein [Streptomyces beijiangensis]|uniref:Phytanoyl-CoA dioxygenase family protein n=1 Tax=Streptomyces beijiangensis TaxID=163361 RepID=A0A939FB06_9ACTN|nr:phytanoyl-CoA dioxygenase family protein [Streptomyces beijiangensis]MBO0514961.1 phytanoyl-CoA dioxygenase family protein [Streptomyces beijiangensis]